MPIPKPHPNEKESEFVNRFMADPVMVKEYPDEKQRVAIAYFTWREKDKKHDSLPTRFCSFHLDGTKAQTTPEGYLVCPAQVTRSGIFDYHDDQDKLIREYRPPEEVFKQESLDSLRLLPVTRNHAGKIITVDNIKSHQVGVTGENVSRDGDFVTCMVKITDRATIDAVQAKRKAGQPVELSCGYDASILQIAGEHFKEGHYDAIQTAIRYNHVSIVDEGRAGPGARLILDKKEGEKSKMAKFKKSAIKLDSFTMDEIDAEHPDEASSLINRLAGKLDEAVGVIQFQGTELRETTKQRDTLQGKFDQVTEDLKKAKIEVDELTRLDSPRVQAMLAEKVRLDGIAVELKVDIKGKSPKDIKIACIQAKNPEFNSDGKSDDYLNARFDAVVEQIGQDKINANQGLGEFRKHALDNSGKTPIDPREQFIQQSQQYGREGKINAA